MSKEDYLVFSVFSSELQCYPYYPFVAKDIDKGVRKFLAFIAHRDTICKGPELHIIGKCKIFKGEYEPQCLSPYICPRKVDIKENLFTRTILLTQFWCDELLRKIYNQYLLLLEERNKKNARKN